MVRGAVVILLLGRFGQEGGSKRTARVALDCSCIYDDDRIVVVNSNLQR